MQAHHEAFEASMSGKSSTLRLHRNDHADLHQFHSFRRQSKVVEVAVVVTMTPLSCWSAVVKRVDE